MGEGTGGGGGGITAGVFLPIEDIAEDQPRDFLLRHTGNLSLIGWQKQPACLLPLKGEQVLKTQEIVAHEKCNLGRSMWQLC